MIVLMLLSMMTGLAVAAVATGRLPRRDFPHRALTLATGAAAGLVGWGLSHAVLGPGAPLPGLAAAAVVAAVLVSLLARPEAGAAPARPLPGPSAPTS
ncbi:hypothetical protein [Streptomyces carpaticus]|uniref:Integral membrane protein n=1 Tax=Streptomyces carpaticus TaxID=285558 RepID=A0ABV4ZLM9_9ACTN